MLSASQRSVEATVNFHPFVFLTFSFLHHFFLFFQLLLPWLLLCCPLVLSCHPLTRLSVVFAFVPPPCVSICGVRLSRVSCVFLCTSWRSEGSPRWPGPSAPCWTWPRPDTRGPPRDLLSACRAAAASCQTGGLTLE